jgi:ABC-type nitrate/sulfonate/bicarbonate transport system ATPase subunit
MPGAEALSVAIARKAYAGRAVLDEVEFEVEPREVVALFGASGTGKSTTLRIALGLDRDFTGQVHRGPGRVGVMFQEPRLLPWLTLAENIRLVATEGVPAPDIGALLASVGLADAAGLLPRALSLGMARRAALARALAVAPALLVLDEPFASLDPALAATLAARVAAEAREGGAAVLIATHGLDQALTIADRVLVLHGSPARLAADLPVAGNGSAGALRSLLLARFPFLGAEETAG